MTTPKAVKKALDHVHSLAPETSTALFTESGAVVFLDENGHRVPITQNTKIDRDIIAEALKAVHYKPQLYKYEPPRVQEDEDLINFVADVVGVVEASRAEYHFLWNEYHYCAEKLGFTKLSWESERVGTGREIGTIMSGERELPVYLSLMISVINGQRILFVEPTSTGVDHDMIREWLDNNMPESAFRDDGRLNMTDADNFHNVLR